MDGYCELFPCWITLLGSNRHSAIQPTKPLRSRAETPDFNAFRVLPPWIPVACTLNCRHILRRKHYALACSCTRPLVCDCR